MKLSVLIIFVFVILFTSCGVGYVATVPPEPPLYVETVPPFVGGIWIGPEYEWREHHYEPVPGHWEHGRKGKSWNQGHWEQNGRGHYWKAGHWK